MRNIEKKYPDLEFGVLVEAKGDEEFRMASLLKRGKICNGGALDLN
jgi:hypothetical protein